ncbi:uncharacterized protein PGTG_21900 [Puccinia graminis f. sp. tritici CRL 75-36-700-3]|uniref:Uncharacterized protein n=1 Tax=Puccinia graminis f. sp. tritici (strain CRL 75-36-700-3 / race SCCL) TaxID=418459 RepID=H6QTD1_PUCGT|nr:uncharacterized protein PGTG_21900 [Puccinia graminis f. sp. tritici CRL 75-36-700-3]EHS64150.1 hypothetical protein PGTG_21900 [Puccinia graminis f. sp. tritici CRL 75-36-700-3]
MEPIDKLSAICPKCFGPPVPGKKENEPDFIVCMDGNFQHRRHLAASSGIPEQNKTFTLFIDPDEVLQMESTMRGNTQPDEVNDNLQPTMSGAQLPGKLVTTPEFLEWLVDMTKFCGL